MILERLQTAVLDWNDRLGQPEVVRSRLKRQRMQAMFLFVAFVAIGVLHYRGSYLSDTGSRIAWAVYIGLFLFVLGGRVFYIQRRLEQLNAPDSE